MSDWVSEYFADVDAMRLDEFIDRHTDDVVVTFANNPPAIGKDQVREAIGGFWGTIDGLSHDIKQRWDAGDTTALESDVTYTRKDGGVVTVPVASFLHRSGDKVDRLTFYLDLTPVFEDSAR
jgi:ketosteroid isomerase-like protein